MSLDFLSVVCKFFDALVKWVNSDIGLSSERIFPATIDAAPTFDLGGSYNFQVLLYSLVFQILDIGSSDS